MHIVDAHIHLWRRVPAWAGYEDTPAQAYGQVVLDGKTIPMLPPSFVDSSSPAELALAHMDRCGVARAIVVQEIMDGFLDEVVIDAVERYPDRFVGEGLPDPRRGEVSADDLDRTFSESPLAGMKIPLGGMQKLSPGFDVDGDLAFAWYEVCRKHGAFVTIHPSLPAQFAGPMRLAAESFPDVTFIIAHAGLPGRDDAWPQVLDLGKLPNVYFELAALPYVYKEKAPCARAAATVVEMARAIGAGKLLWGSDYPRTLTDLTYQQQIEMVSLGCGALSHDERALILGGAAERLFAAAGIE